MTSSKPATATSFLICDLRDEWKWCGYITFWRPNNSNYAYPLVWAGDYAKADVDAKAHYYTERQGKILKRFAVPRAIAEAISEAPERGLIDGDTGPVVRNTADNRRKLREAAYIPSNFLEGLE